MSRDHSRTTSPTRYSKATHLTEFYPYLNGGSVAHSVTQDVPHQPTSMHSRKQSLSSYTSFTPSTLDFRTLVTKTDVTHTTDTFEELLTASEKYRKALMQVAEAAGDFGAALEKTAKCKGAGTAADGLLSAGGLFFLVANHQQVLAHTVGESFEMPVRREVTKFKEQSTQNDESFRVEIRDRVRELKQQEKENAKLSRSKTRNLVAYRSKLMQLTSHIDEIDKLKHEYYQSAFDLVQETSNHVLMQVGSVVRAQVEIYEGIARKGWSGGGLDELIAQCPDPFTTAEDDDDDDENDNVMGTNDVSSHSNHSDTLQLRREPELSMTDQGLTFNRGMFATKPVLSHQQSIQSFRTTDSLTASTPIMMSPKSIKSEDDHDRTIGPEDNSFSLPVPGSARLKKADNESISESPVEDPVSEETGEPGGLQTDQNAEQEESKPSSNIEEFTIQNEWRDDSDGIRGMN